MEKARLAGLLALLGVVLASALWVTAGNPLAGLYGVLGDSGGRERLAGYCSLVDREGRVLLRTGLGFSVGNIFIDADDRVYRVVSIEGDTALAEYQQADEGQSEFSPPPFSTSDPRLWAGLGPGSEAASPGAPLGVPLGTARRVVVIYHTHSDESYIPTSGTAHIPGGGGVYQVGEALATGLRAKGFTVVHDWAAHDPHDAGAYPRSRRTALQDLRYGPTFLFDVHRDSAPVADYLTRVDGLETSSILIVIGGANPLSQGNLATARRLKQFSDELHPGLVRGIYVARGNYNQDLDPGAILLEVGTDGLPRKDAERAAALFSDAVAAFTGPPGPDDTTGGSTGETR